MNPGNRIQRARLALGWTQQELAQRSGLSKHTIEMYEQGKRTRLETIARIGDALGVPVDALMRGAPNGHASEEEREAAEFMEQLEPLAPRIAPEGRTELLRLARLLAGL